jgi:hypothetical protein
VRPEEVGIAKINRAAVKQNYRLNRPGIAPGDRGDIGSLAITLSKKHLRTRSAESTA